MAEQAAEKKSGSKTILKIIIGILLVAGGIALAILCREELWILIQGCVGPFLIMAGAITLAIAKE